MNKNWFTRKEQTDVNEKYLHNMTKATHFFRNWFDKPTTNYKDMLYQMHKIIAEEYNGYTKSNYIVKSVLGFRGERETTWYPILDKKWFDRISDERIISPELKSHNLSGHHYLENTIEGYVLHLTPSEYMDIHIKQLAFCMRQLQNTITIDKIANYIHLFVVTHPFEKINFSLCMAQANLMLEKIGEKPILYGYLDFECFVYDWLKILDIFTKMVKRT